MIFATALFTFIQLKLFAFSDASKNSERLGTGLRR